MSIIVCDGVSLSIGTKEILKNISFSVNEGVKLGIIGVNGAGKSTLASVIMGKTEPTSGNVYINGDKSIGMLSQRSEEAFRGKTVYDVASSPFSELIKQEAYLDSLLSKASVNPGVLQEYERQRHDFEIKGGMEYKTKIRSMLARFGFGSDMNSFPADSLSGGQKTRLALVSLLMSGKDILILDEPTNHLDTETVEWLEDFINSSGKTYLIISHDRYFLDKVTTETLEIENLTSVKYPGNYSEFKEKKKVLTEIQEKHYELQQKEISRIEAYIENQIRWGREKNFIAAKSRQKLLDKMERIEKPKAPPKAVKISIGGTASGNSVLSVRHISKAFGDNVLFTDISFEVTKGERVMLIGNNGCGKSTLLKIINGTVNADKGICESGYSQIVGYYDQEMQILDENNTVVGEILDADSSLLPVQARTFLGSYGFYGDDVFKTVGMLSGGERARLSIAKLVLKKVSFLILDEPTNHLDIPSKEAFESALSEFDGTILAVSHDRYFIKTLGSRIIEIDKNGYPDGYFDFCGGYDNFLQKRIKQATKQTVQKESTGRNEFENAKKKKGEKRSKAKRYEFLEREISRLEARCAEIEKQTEENPSDYVLLAKLDTEKNEIAQTLDNCYDEFLTLEEEMQSDN